MKDNQKPIPIEVQGDHLFTQCAWINLLSMLKDATLWLRMILLKKALSKEGEGPRNPRRQVKSKLQHRTVKMYQLTKKAELLR